jgi:hypothetical protein
MHSHSSRLFRARFAPDSRPIRTVSRIAHLQSRAEVRADSHRFTHCIFTISRRFAPIRADSRPVHRISHPARRARCVAAHSSELPIKHSRKVACRAASHIRLSCHLVPHIDVYVHVFLAPRRWWHMYGVSICGCPKWGLAHVWFRYGAAGKGPKVSGISLPFRVMANGSPARRPPPVGTQARHPPAMHRGET